MINHPERHDLARAELLLSAARIANDDTALGNPDAILDAVVNPTLSVVDRARYFASLLEVTASISEWRTVVDHCGADSEVDRIAAAAELDIALDRALVIVTVLLNGQPECAPTVSEWCDLLRGWHVQGAAKQNAAA